MFRLCLHIITLSLSLFVGSIAHASFSYGTIIRTDNGSARKIEELAEGDLIQTLSLESTINRFQFEQVKLNLSNTIGNAASAQTLVTINFLMNNTNSEIVVSPDQPLYTSKGLLMRADKLAVGDFLLGADGSTCYITNLKISDEVVGVHAIATEAKNNIQNTIIANGILAGSFSHQIFYVLKDLGEKSPFEFIPFN